MARTEYVGVDTIDGPFLMLGDIRGVGYDELVEITSADGIPRQGKVVLVDEGATLVQVFSGTQGLTPSGTRIRFSGAPLEIAVAPSIIGRTFDGLGRPRDDCGPVLGGERRNVNGAPINPMARLYPRDFISTGLSVVDTLTRTRGELGL